MSTSHAASLAGIRRFDQLVAYLRDEMSWPIERGDFEDLTFEYSTEELGIDAKNAAKIEEIKSLRPLCVNQPWGVFFVRFEPKRLPVIALRRILSQVAVKKRAGVNTADRAAWAVDDLLFISNYGEGSERHMAFAHFSQPPERNDLPTLKVLGWDNLDTPLHLTDVADTLTNKLAWPEDEKNAEVWREKWRSAFTLRHREVIRTSQELSVRLADLARAIRDRIRTAVAIETEVGPLTKLMKAFQSALIHDLDADSFADMYAQTIAYGLLSARITDPDKKTTDDFAAHMRTNPFLRELMETFLKVGGRRGKAGGPGIDFDELGVSEVVDLLDAAKMDAVVRDFGDRNRNEDPVIHFYELFLKEYDVTRRLQRGVFYTPRPVVSYIVRSAHEALKNEFNLADGLADNATWGDMVKRRGNLTMPDGVSADQDFVQILDPATGTGTFLVEVIDLIHETLVGKWKAQGHREQEINVLWNEYVPRHLLTRLYGYELLMAPYAIAHLKIGLKLYETGYRFGSDERAHVYLTNALEPAQDYSERLEFATPALAHEARAVNEIKQHRSITVVIGNPPYSKSSSNRTPAAEGLVAEYKRLIVGETNVQPLSDDYVKFLSFAFRASLKGSSLIGMITNRSYLDGLIHRGMRSTIGKECSKIMIVDLHGDSNVGEHPPSGKKNENVFDIQQGVAISLFVRTGILADSFADVLRQDAWGTREEKFDTLAALTQMRAILAAPAEPYWFFANKDLKSQSEQKSWVGINDLFRIAGMGVKSRRDHFLISDRRDELHARMSSLASGSSLGLIRQEMGVTDNDQWTLERMRALVRREGVDDRIVRITYRPFDFRYIWYHREAIERGDARWPVMKHVLHGGLSLLTSRQSANYDFSSVFVARGLSEMKAAESSRGSYAFPLMLSNETQLLDECAPLNIIKEAFGPTISRRTSEEVLYYMYALLHSPEYRRRYAGALRIEFPKMPKHCSESLVRELCTFGAELVTLHLMESSELANPITKLVGSRAPIVEKVTWSKGSVWTNKAQTVGFEGVREDVWSFRVGGYQVCEKWLKDRKGRTLSVDDVDHYQKIIVALSRTISLMKKIDEVIERHGGWPDAFTSPTEKMQDN